MSDPRGPRESAAAVADAAAQALYRAMIGNGGPEATGWTGPLSVPGEPRARGSVLILGAGVAGLTAAFELCRRGYTCTVLEAQNRVGGRNRTARRIVGAFRRQISERFGDQVIQLQAEVTGIALRGKKGVQVTYRQGQASTSRRRTTASAPTRTRYCGSTSSPAASPRSSAARSRPWSSRRPARWAGRPTNASGSGSRTTSSAASAGPITTSPRCGIPPMTTSPRRAR
ncbi:NAD(P)-binding protein [Streptacidiphilus sp. 4-A2]|nr:NAD(P)-binding protein [Streptacidiphilus sp. 4-A2]